MFGRDQNTPVDLSPFLKLLSKELMDLDFSQKVFPIKGN